MTPPVTASLQEMETEDSTLAAPCYFTTLPQELLEMILLQLDIADIWRLRNLTRNFSSRCNPVFLRRRRMERSYFPYLPIEVLENIFQYLSIIDLWKLRKLSRICHAIIRNYVWNMTSLDLGERGNPRQYNARSISRIELDKMVNVRTIKSICGWDKHVFHKLLDMHLPKMTDLEELRLVGEILSTTVTLLNSRPRNLLHSFGLSFWMFGGFYDKRYEMCNLTEQTVEQTHLVMKHNWDSLKTIEITLLKSQLHCKLNKNLYSVINVNVLQDLTVNFQDGKFAPQFCLSLNGYSVDLSQSNFPNLEKLDIYNLFDIKLPVELIELEQMCLVPASSSYLDLSKCELPKLKHLKLTSIKNLTLPDILPELEYFRIHSLGNISLSTCQFPKLTNLDVYCLEFEFTNIPPQLKHLRLNSDYCPEFSPSSSCQFPNLKTSHVACLRQLCFPVSPSLRTLIISHTGPLTLHQAGSSVEPFPALQKLTLNLKVGLERHQHFALIFEWRVGPVVLPKELVSLFCKRLNVLPLYKLEFLSNVQELTTVEMKFQLGIIPLINSLWQVSRLVITDLDNVTPTEFLSMIERKWNNRIDIEIYCRKLLDKDVLFHENELNKQFGDKLNGLVRLIPLNGYC